MPTAQISPMSRTLPHTLYVRVPSYSFPRPRVTDFTEFEPTSGDRGIRFIKEAASYVHEYNRELPKVAVLSRRWIGYVSKRVETEVFSITSAGRRTSRGIARSGPKGHFAPSTLSFPARPEGNQNVELTPVWMSMERPACPRRRYDIAYTYTCPGDNGSKWTYTWRVSPESQYTLTLWAFQSDHGDNSSEEASIDGDNNDGSEELEYLVASFYGGKMASGEIEGVLEMQDKREEAELDSEGATYSGTNVHTDEALMGLLEALRIEMKYNKVSKRRAAM